MHILGGKLKGKKLANCKTRSIKPAMGIVRKSIFDTLKSFVEDAHVLDLCAGTGIIGIEALSRGAKSLTLIDSNKFAVQLIRKNLTLCNLDAKIIHGALPQVIKKLNPDKGKFNLIFLDPPYGQSEFIEEVLTSLIAKDLIETGGLLLIESEAKSDFLLPKELKLYKEKQFGNTKITILNR